MCCYAGSDVACLLVLAKVLHKLALGVHQVHDDGVVHLHTQAQVNTASPQASWWNAQTILSMPSYTLHWMGGVPQTTLEGCRREICNKVCLDQWASMARLGVCMFGWISLGSPGSHCHHLRVRHCSRLYRPWPPDATPHCCLSAPAVSGGSLHGRKHGHPHGHPHGHTDMVIHMATQTWSSTWPHRHANQHLSALQRASCALTYCPQGFSGSH